MVNSRRKGSKNEREVAKLLKQWTGYDFARTPSSGGLRWKKTDNITGDIICTDAIHRFPFSVETKFYIDINFQHLLYLPSSDILKFWDQALEDSKRGKKLPILFMRYNGLPKNFHFICLAYQDFIKLRKHLNLSHDKLIFNKTFVIINPKVLLDAPYKPICKAAKTLLKKRLWD